MIVIILQYNKTIVKSSEAKEVAKKLENLEHQEYQVVLAPTVDPKDLSYKIIEVPQ